MVTVVNGRASNAATLTGTYAIGQTLTATLPVGVVGTLQFTRTLVAAPFTKSAIAGAVAEAVNSLAYTLASADGGYTVGVDASKQVTPTVGGSVAVAPVSPLYMIASNRFAIPTDVGTGDANYNANFVGTTSGASNVVAFTSYKGSTAAGAGLVVGGRVTGAGITNSPETTITAVNFTDATSGTVQLSAVVTLSAVTVSQNAQHLGGNGVEAAFGGRYHSHREIFSTTWAPVGGRYLFANVVMQPAGLVEIKTPVNIQRCELRKVTAYTNGVPSASVLVEVIKFLGAGNYLMPGGGYIFTDGLTTTLDPSAAYFFDVWWQINLGDVFPSNTTFNILPGESTRSSASNLSLSAMATSGTSSALGGSSFGPIAFFAKGWDGAACGLIIGDSTQDLTNIVAAILNRDVGHASIGYGSATGGSMNYQETARWSTAMNVLYAPAVSSATAGANVYGLFDWLYNTINAGLGQTRAPWQFIHSNMGKNNIAGGGSTLSSVQGAFASAVNKARSLWPNLPWIQETLTPYVNATNNSGHTDDVNVTAGNAGSANAGSGGYIQPLNTWIMTGGGGLFNLAIDVAGPLRSTTNYMAWKEDGFVATLITALIANNTGTLTLSAAPALGTAIALEPGTSNVDIGYIVYAVRQNADGINFDMDVAAANRAPVYKKVTLAHAAGISVKGATAPDGLHQSHKGSISMANSIIAVKAQVATIANAYNGT